MDMLNPLHLRTLRVVIEQGSFVGAANRLGYTPSAVSQQMSALEQSTGRQLFNRSGRSIQPTEVALIIAEHAHEVLNSLNTLMHAVATTSEMVSTTSVIGFSSLMSRITPLILSDEEWLATNHRLSVSIHDPSLAIREAAARPTTTAVLVYLMGDRGLSWPEVFEPVSLGIDRFVVVVPPQWQLDARLDDVAPLRNRHWVLHHPGSSDADLIEQTINSLALSPDGISYSDDFTATIALVAGGLGAAIVPEFVAAEAGDRVATVGVPGFEMHRELVALISKRTPETCRSAFEAALRRAMCALGYEAPTESVT